MNLDQLKRDIGYRVQLEPMACMLDEYGREMPTPNDDWLIESVSDTGIKISNLRTSHFTTLGKDQIHHFTSNPDRSSNDVKYGFLTLHVQIYIQGLSLSYRPTKRPGEKLGPPAVNIAEK